MAYFMWFLLLALRKLLPYVYRLHPVFLAFALRFVYGRWQSLLWRSAGRS
jgi:hypothetical protein